MLGGGLRRSPRRLGASCSDSHLIRGQRHCPGLFWSATNGAHVVYESLLELAWLWLADFDPGVERIAAQPFHLRDPATNLSRYPDFLPLGVEGAVAVVDVKAPRLLEKPGAREALAWTASVLQTRGWRYVVWTQPDPIALRNVRMLAVARRPGLIDPIDVGNAVQLCGDGARFADLEEQLGPLRIGMPARLVLFGALWAGQLRCDISEPVRCDTWLEPAA